MTATKTPFGFEPARRQGGGVANQGMNRYAINNGYASNIFYGDPVALSSGFVIQSSVSSDKALGVFAGCVFNNPTNGNQPTYSRYWPTGTSVTDGSQPYAWVIDSPHETFFIQADASISIGAVGLNYPVSLGTAATVTNGRSAYLLKAASSTGSQLVQVVDIKQTPDNAWSDAFTIVEVKWVQHRNAYTSAA